MLEKRILLLEDEPQIAEILALALDGEGYLVDLAATIAEARARLASDAQLFPGYR